MQRVKASQREGNPPKAARGSPGEARGGWDRSVRPKGAKGDSPGQSEAPPWVRLRDGSIGSFALDEPFGPNLGRFSRTLSGSRDPPAAFGVWRVTVWNAMVFE